MHRRTYFRLLDKVIAAQERVIAWDVNWLRARGFLSAESGSMDDLNLLPRGRASVDQFGWDPHEAEPLVRPVMGPEAGGSGRRG
jgi:hypothetical protein